MLCKLVSFCCCLMAVGLVTSQSHADVLDFEDFAPPGGFELLPPPYTEDGFTLTTSVKQNAGVFDSDWPDGSMPGNDTDYFAFSNKTTITLTTGKESGTTFDLFSLLVGPFVTETADLTITGFFSDLSVETVTLQSLTTATTETLSWTDLTSVEFSSFNGTFGGLDDIVINEIPEPGSTAVIVLMSAVVISRRRR